VNPLPGQEDGNDRPSPVDFHYSPVVLPDPRPDSAAGLSHATAPDASRRAEAGEKSARRSIGPVQDPKLEIQMLHDRVMVRADSAGERTSNAGIVIPATAEVPKRLVWGEVFGVGTYVRTVKVGDRVLYARDDQFEVDVQGSTYLVLRERELHAVATERTEHGTGLYL
jgi:chaperonin GroES